MRDWETPPMSELIQTDKRQLCLRILRYNPQDPESRPHFQDYQLEQADGMTLFTPSLRFANSRIQA
jgi:hypothetical protein